MERRVVVRRLNRRRPERRLESELERDTLQGVDLEQGDTFQVQVQELIGGQWHRAQKPQPIGFGVATQYDLRQIDPQLTRPVNDYIDWEMVVANPPAVEVTFDIQVRGEWDILPVTVRGIVKPGVPPEDEEPPEPEPEEPPLEEEEDDLVLAMQEIAEVLGKLSNILHDLALQLEERN